MSNAGSPEQLVTADLLTMLVCPVDKEDLQIEGRHLVCTACGRRYPVEDGIPNMLTEEE